MKDVARFYPVLLRARALVLDVDGVLTDGRLYFGAKGEALKAFHVRDGAGIKMVGALGVKAAIISGRKSPAATARAKELGIRHVQQGVKDKSAALHALVARLGIALDQVVSVGDDVPDIPMLAQSGLGVAVADAHEHVTASTQVSTSLPGGRGAVREVCDWILAAHASRT